MKENKHFDTNGRTNYSVCNAPIADTAKAEFPIVGIGASAGGTLLAFLGKVPRNSGLAYVIVQHILPVRSSTSWLLFYL